jgi:hypothetical protein
MGFDPYQLGWKAWIYCLGIAIATPFLHLTLCAIGSQEFTGQIDQSQWRPSLSSRLVDDKRTE